MEIIVALAGFGALCAPGTFARTAAALRSSCQEDIQSARIAPGGAIDGASAELRLARALARCHEENKALTAYRQLLRSQPKDAAVWYEFGEFLAHNRQPAQAASAFQRMLALKPRNAGGELGLAEVMLKLGHNHQVLRLSDDVLAHDAHNTDALKVKAFALERTGDLAQAGRIFKQLIASNPADSESCGALCHIEMTEDSRRWHSLRPAPGSPPQAFVSYYLSYLADHPQDAAALKNLAAAEAQIGNYTAAIRADQHALRLNPQDRSAQTHLARVLSWDRQYGASIKIYRALLQSSPKDRTLLESLARVYLWSGQRQDALDVERRLQALDPANEQFALAAARLEMNLKKNQAADRTLHGILSQHPQNFEAHLLAAREEQSEGHLHKALKEYEWALGQNFKNVTALYGAAQINTYLGHPDRAYPLAMRLVEEHPRDFDALLLLARLDRERGRRKAAMALLSRAAQLSPANPELQALKEQIQGESSVTIRTTGSYVREVAQSAGPFPGVTEDLNAYSGGMRVGFNALPKSQSYVLLSATPSNSPSGGIQGAAAPTELLYGQTTEISKSLFVRGGAGVVRMGPGEIFTVAELPPRVRSLSFTPIAFAGASFLPQPRLHFDFAVSRSAITYTPASVRFGATDIRIDLGVSYTLDPRTQFRAALFHEIDSSPVYDQTDFALGGAVLLERNGRDSGNGASADIERTVLRSERLALSLGYSGLLLGYTGQRRGVFMGFFNPAFYQRHFMTSRLHGKLWGPMDYTLVGDFGVQQVDQGRPVTRAFQAGPALTFRMSRQHSVTIGYLHYDFAQSLGKLKGNILQFSSDWSF
ncbi:MAG TPA: tetratricopeptide repeat protein [Terriglobia bacterium]|nr:tetratricopeptide repeat protein [Terriglobia bacterium]